MRLRSKLDKKGLRLTNEQLLTLLLILVSSTVVMYLIIHVGKIVDGSADNACAAEVRNAAFINKYGSREFALDITKCPTEYIAVNESDLRGDKEAAAKRELAEAMRTCWETWGKGELDLFNEPGAYCHVCSVVRFEETHTIRNFDEYLMTQKAPSGRPYAEVLTGYTSENSGVTIEKLSTTPYTIQTDQPYVILFYYMKEKDGNDIYQTLLGTQAGAPSRAAAIAGFAGFGGGLAAAELALAAGVTVAAAPVAVTAAAGAAIATYLIADSNDDFYTLSAMYLIPEDPEKLSTYECQKAAAIAQSP